MGRLDRFMKDEKGTTFEGIALSVSIIAVAFVASADMLDYLTKPHEQAAMTASAPPPQNNGNLDFSPTASLPKLVAHSVLDPCTGEVK